MLLNASLTPSRRFVRLIVWLLVLSLLAATLPAARAQDSGATEGSSSINIATRECERPPQCFASVEARQAWARSNNCYFLEDVCSEAPKDDGGARAEDRGFWGSLWDKGVAGIKYGYNFLRGLFDGLKDQIEGIVELITNAGDVVKGLIELGKAFYDDPKGTTHALAELMGQGAVNLITRATECGPYDLGRVIGEWVSPAVMVRVATRLGRYGDDVVAAVRNTKRDLGCASFAAGTLIWTEDGLAPIERVRIGERLLARDDRLWHDAPQRVTMTFERVAPNYHALRTELETYRVTDEHPLWVQGKGWTEVSQITEQDVLVLRHGDARVLANTRVDEPVEVYNFTVENTSNYFVGEHGLWAHNCTITRVEDLKATPWGLLTAHQRGYLAEVRAHEYMLSQGYTPIKGVDTGPGGFERWRGQTGIDAIYEKDGKYVVVESKGSGAAKPGDPEGCVGGLCKLTGGERQMSNEWIKKRVDEDRSLTPAQQKAIMDGLGEGGSTQRVYAFTDENGTRYNTIKPVLGKDGFPVDNDVVIVGSWNP